MPEADKKEWEEWADNSLARQIAALRRVDTLFSRAAPKAFAIEAAGERMVVSTADFRTWRRDYRLRVDHSETFCQAGDEARSLGADAVMRLDRASDVHVEFR
jgi:hypothetical protein